MKRMMQVTAAVALSLTVACAGDRSPDAEKPNEQPAATAGSSGSVGTSGTSAAEREFVDEQLAMGTAEIELGRLAQKRGTHADVKEFGAMMVRDHEMAGDELKPIAARVNTTRENAATADKHGDHKEHFEELSKLSGRDFDRRYIDQMIEDHEKGIEDVERQAENANDAAVKSWAAKTLPKMRQHLERAKSIKETLNRAGNQ